MEYTQQMVAVGVVLATLGAVFWFARRRGWTAVAAVRRSERRLQAIERLPLGTNHTLHLVRVGEQTLVVACSPAGCALLDRVKVGSEVSVREDRL